MFEHEDRELIKELIRLMSANDDALTALNTQVTDLQTAVTSVQTDVAALIAGLGTTVATNSDISAGVNAAAASLATASAALATVSTEVKAATAPKPVPTVFSIPDQTLTAALGGTVNYQITTAGTPIGTVTFQPVSGLPAGLSNDATGLVTGQAAASFSGTLTVNATDQGTPTNSAIGNLTVSIA